MRSFPILLSAVALSGCAVGSDYVRPEVKLTPRYASTAVIAPADARWWTAFSDPKLEALVDRALAQNLEVAAAAARVDQARAAARQAGAVLLPAFDGTGSAQRINQSLKTPVGVVSNRLGFPRDYSLYELGGQASWEVDLFGGLGRGREAARADFDSAEAEAAAVRLAIAAETVDAYLQLRGLQARYTVASRQLDNERQLVSLVRQQVDQGLVAERELNRIQGEAQGIEAHLAPIRASVAAQINRLAVLTGRQAGSDPDGLAMTNAIPATPDPSGSAAPAELMRRRPDVVAAEQKLAAAHAWTGVAIADYYPKISLSGLLGVASVGTGALFTGDAVQASGGAGLRWRLFDFGRVDAEVAGARGQEAEALARYRGAILRATEDVETALSRLTEARAEIQVRTREVQMLTRSRDQARQAYEGGVLALVAVLDADRALLEASDRLVLAQTEASRASLTVIKALGGGWEMRS